VSDPLELRGITAAAPLLTSWSSPELHELALQCIIIKFERTRMEKGRWRTHSCPLRGRERLAWASLWPAVERSSLEFWLEPYRPQLSN
jgi:hypothetical protein